MSVAVRRGLTTGLAARRPLTITSARSLTTDQGSPLLQQDAKCILGTYARFPLHITRGEGMYVFDHNGKRILDFAAGIAVNSLGHAHPIWLKALQDQAAKLSHVSNLYYTEPAVDLAELLVDRSPMDKVYFCNSGTEANEAAIKFARRAALARGKTNGTVIAFNHSFHGRTMGALSITGKKAIREPFEPLLPNVKFSPFNDVESIERLFDDSVEAVFVEPVQGEGGIHTASNEFLQCLRKLCDRHHASLVFDEVQCGVGRLGRLWAHEGSGVQPDMMTLAKPLAGGLPIGAVLLKEEVAQCIEFGDHGSTFAGNPLVCAVARETFRLISQPSFLDTIKDTGDYLNSRLLDMQAKFGSEIEVVRGEGLLAGVQLAPTLCVGKAISACIQRGLLFPSCGVNTMRFCPPLIAERKHVDEAVNILTDVFKSGEAQAL